MMTTAQLMNLTHEQLVGWIATELDSAPAADDEAPTRYLRNRAVPAAKIHPYPKRRPTRRFASNHVVVPAPAVPVSPELDLSYEMFIRMAVPLRIAV